MTGLFLLSEGRQAWIPDPIYAAVAPMLDGAHEVEAIFEALSDAYPVEQVFAALDRLRTSGYLAEDTAVEARPTMAFWEHAGVRPSLARSRLDVTLVSIVAIGDVDIESLTELLGRQGVKVAPEGDVTVVVTDDYLRPELAAWNTRSLISEKAWLLAKPVGIETWIGPMFVPGQTACWECLAQRLRGHRKLEEYIARRNGTDAPVGVIPACIASTQHAALGRSSNGDHTLDRNRRAVDPPGPGRVDERHHTGTNPPHPHPPSPVPLVRLSRAGQCPSQAGAPPSTPEGPYIGRRASRPRPTGGARAT